MMWGRAKENGVWQAKDFRWKILIGGGDRLVYVAIGYLRIRLMNPFIK